jgi:hypothetical protein
MKARPTSSGDLRLDNGFKTIYTEPIDFRNLKIELEFDPT